MPTELPYMASVTNVKGILEKIRAASTPPKFTHEFLQNNLGFRGSNDRSIIKVLKQLGFLSADSIPTPRYNDFRDQTRSGQAMATGLREGWSPVFLSDERAYERSSGQLKELFKNVTGVGDSVAVKHATTFKALAEIADWNAQAESTGADRAVGIDETDLPAPLGRSGALSLHHDVHVHLPQTSDVSVYSAIFRALREEFLD